MEIKNNLPLALKYRPKNFNELIGQDIMVETITNAVNLNKLPNAYLLTGIRGVGKTTTARLIAKALNCSKNFITIKSGENCECNNCEEISKSKHLDVLEMDAASRTGIDDVRELIESSKYNPTSAKYKIYIIDEIHMLSKQAFNGLLKTLEEPPPHLKFVFCTTEVKKIPITIISRCQRFDLHRVQIKELIKHLEKILKLENRIIPNEALKLVAKASEGSVRDSLSLLDRALISEKADGKKVDENFIRKMLGIADRSKILHLLDLVFQGNQKESIEKLKELINEGIDAKNFLNDLLEIIYFIQQKKYIGSSDTDLSISESEKETINSISNKINSETLIVSWQLILKVIDELSIVSNPLLSLEMLIVRMVYLKEMPSYENVLESLKNNNSNQEKNTELELNQKKISSNNEQKEVKKISKDQIKNITQTKPSSFSTTIEAQTINSKYEKISSFEELIFMSSQKKEIQLKYDLENNVNLIKFSDGKIDIGFNTNLEKNFVRNLSEKLFEWTGSRWVITLTKKEGAKTYSEQKNLEKKKIIEEEKKGEIYKEFKNVFSDGELLEVKKKD